MGIYFRKVDAFFRIQVTLEPEQSNIFNSTTNLLFVPLQHVVGQKKYQSLKGKVAPIPVEENSPENYFLVSALTKVVVCFVAVIATPVGFFTRCLSFAFSDVRQAYTLAFLLQLAEAEFSSLTPDQFPKELLDLAREARKTQSLVLASSSPPVESSSKSNSQSPTTSSQLQRDLAVLSQETQRTQPKSSTPSSALVLEKTSQVGHEIVSEPEKVNTFTLFWVNLNNLLNLNPTDPAPIEAWLKAEISKEDYPGHFFFAEMYLHDLYVDGSPDYEKMKLLYERCVVDLKRLGLDRYLNETPTPQMMESEKKNLEPNKFWVNFIKNCLSILRPLSLKLQKLTGTKDNDRQTIKTWLDQIKSKPSPKYYNPFVTSPYLIYRYKNGLLTDVLDAALVQELDRLHTACREQLLALDLKEYVDERIPRRVLPIEVEKAAQAPHEPSSVVLSQHLRFYSEKYPETVKRAVGPKTLMKWEQAVRSLPLEKPPLPTDGQVKAVYRFLMTLTLKVSQDPVSAKEWLVDQTRSESYSYPFYQAAYWQTLVDLEKHANLKQLADCYKKAVISLSRIGAVRLLDEVPRERHEGVFLLSHLLISEEIILPISKELQQQKKSEPVQVQSSPAPVETTPVLGAVPDHSHVDDSLFKKAIVELLPKMGPLLENPEMLLYWKNSLLDRTTVFCFLLMGMYERIFANCKTKGDMEKGFRVIKEQDPSARDLELWFSKDYARVFEKLAPFLIPNLSARWKVSFDQFSLFCKKISAEEYLDKKALHFLGDDSVYAEQIQAELSQTLNFFERLAAEKNDENLDKKIQNDDYIKKHLGRPFWFARELDNLLIGYGVSLLPKQKKTVRQLKQLFESTKARLTRLQLERFLQEPAPKRNFLTLRRMQIPDEVLTKLKKER